MPRLVPTPYGPARLSATGRGSHGTVLLMHGAGSSTDVPVLRRAADQLTGLGWRSVRLDHPYIVAGRRTPPPAAALDRVVDLVLARVRPRVLVGRSSGARAACRAAARHPDQVELVVTVGFPLSPPGRPGVSREAELRGCPCPVLAVQGERDGFGGPGRLLGLGLPQVTVRPVADADHELAVPARSGRDPGAAVEEVVALIVAACGALSGC